MDRAFEFNDKLAIILIIIGFILGIYLAVGHDNPDLWFFIVQMIFIVAIIMTVISAVVGVNAKRKYGEKFTVTDVLRMFALNIAMIAVCTSFGFVLGSVLIGNYIMD